MSCKVEKDLGAFQLSFQVFYKRYIGCCAIRQSRSEKLDIDKEKEPEQFL